MRNGIWIRILLSILSLDNERYNKYENELRKYLSNEEIGGDDLFDVNESDIKGWSINNFNDEKNLSRKIKELVGQNHKVCG